MQRINNIYAWQMIEVGQKMRVDHDSPEVRAVRINVHAPSPAALYIEQDDLADPIFLCRIDKLDEIQFQIVGGYSLIAIGGEVWIETLDGAQSGLQPVDDTSFTSIMTRKTRNPEVEIMERLMYENMHRRLNEMAASVDQMLSQKEIEHEVARKALADATAKLEQLAAAGGTSPAPIGSVPPTEGG